MPQKVNQVVNFQISTFAEIFSSLRFFCQDNFGLLWLRHPNCIALEM